MGTIVGSGCDSKRISAIGWSMYCMHISTIIVCVGSSTVLAIGSCGWQYNASNGVIFCRQIGTESCLCPYIPTLAVLSFCTCGGVGRQ